MPAAGTALQINAGCSTVKFSCFGIWFLSVEPRSSDKERSFESSGGPDV